MSGSCGAAGWGEVCERIESEVGVAAGTREGIMREVRERVWSHVVLRGWSVS